MITFQDHKCVSCNGKRAQHVVQEASTLAMVVIDVATAHSAENVLEPARPSGDGVASLASNIPLVRFSDS